MNSLREDTSKIVSALQKALNNINMRYIKQNYEHGYIDDDDLDFLIKQNGTFEHDGNSYDFSKGSKSDFSSFRDKGDLLDAYANHIQNYIYNYAPEATMFDDNIDPDEEQVGPMAQDIEQVNPACIDEMPNGIKTVNTEKLALMNAGAIGDIARQLKELTAKLESLGIN